MSSIMAFYVGKGRIISCVFLAVRKHTVLSHHPVLRGSDWRVGNCPHVLGGLMRRCEALHRVAQKDSLRLNTMTFSRSQRVPMIEQGSRLKSPLSPNT